MEEQYDWINSRERFLPSRRDIVPPIDKIISEIVGFAVYTTDPRLIKLVVKFKRMKVGNEDTPDNFLENPQFIKELKEVFVKKL